MLSKPLGRHNRTKKLDRTTGQSLVEFALTLPIFVLVMMGLIEFGFLYNNILTIQFASRQGASAAALLGSDEDADCAILRAVERSLTAPIDRTRIVAITVFESDAAGDPVTGRINRYVRTGSLTCASGEVQPYSLDGTEGYPETDRRDTLAAGLDVIGVKIGYTYAGITPIGAGRSWPVDDASTLRVEPRQ